MRESIHHGGKRNVRWEAVGEYQHYNRTGMERLHSKCVYRLYFKEFWKRNLYIKDWVNMKTAKNKYKHKKRRKNSNPNSRRTTSRRGKNRMPGSRHVQKRWMRWSTQVSLTWKLLNLTNSDEINMKGHDHQGGHL